jgi:glycosyltransferase involved in cell wall biosynthesis
MKVSVVIPAYNEELYLPKTLAALTVALGSIPAEVIVVDNESKDSTRDIATDFGARIVDEPEHNIGRVRNTGAHEATGDLLVFLDADTLVAPGLFEKIIADMSDERCFGGSVAVDYETEFRRILVRWFMRLWAFMSRFTKMRQGAMQFCRAEVFRELGGYDTTIYVGEDVEFHWRLDKLATDRKGHTVLIDGPRVRTSSRRWDQMGLARMLFFTHPATMLLAWRNRSFWKDWYENAIR